MDWPIKRNLWENIEPPIFFHQLALDTWQTAQVLGREASNKTHSQWMLREPFLRTIFRDPSLFLPHPNSPFRSDTLNCQLWL